MWRKAADVSYWFGASLYFGGLVTLGAVVAPSVFNTSSAALLSMPGIAAPPLVMGPQVGGEIFGDILNRFAWVQVIALSLMFAGLAAWVLGHKVVRRSTWVLIVLWALVAVFTAYDAGFVRPRVWSLRSAIREKAEVSHAANTKDWPEQVEFDALHSRAETVGHCESYVLMAMILVAAWRGLAEKPARAQ